jgi:hypothetical protein
MFLRLFLPQRLLNVLDLAVEGGDSAPIGLSFSMGCPFCHKSDYIFFLIMLSFDILATLMPKGSEIDKDHLVHISDLNRMYLLPTIRLLCSQTSPTLLSVIALNEYTRIVNEYSYFYIMFFGNSLSPYKSNTNHPKHQCRPARKIVVSSYLQTPPIVMSPTNNTYEPEAQEQPEDAD